MSKLPDLQKKCSGCEMMLDRNEYHPYAACLLFKQTKNSETVRENLIDVRNKGIEQAAALVALVDGHMSSDEIAKRLLSVGKKLTLNI